MWLEALLEGMTAQFHALLALKEQQQESKLLYGKGCRRGTKKMSATLMQTLNAVPCILRAKVCIAVQRVCTHKHTCIVRSRLPDLGVQANQVAIHAETRQSKGTETQ